MKTSRLLVPLLTALAGCSLLAPRPDPSRFYVLTALATADGSGGRLDDVTVGVGPVIVPAYLQRPQIATRVGPNQVAYDEYTRWAQPLESGVSRVLVQNLAVLLAPAQVGAFPWLGPPTPTHSVEVEVCQFEQSTADTVQLFARWTIRDGRTKAILAARETTASEPAAGNDPAATVAALSRTLATLSRDVAAAVRSTARR